MRKVIAAINMTLDGSCDHTVGIADDETHAHYNALLRGVDTMLFGRITYQLMENSWPEIVETPTGNQSIDEFAVLIDNIRKVVFSHTLEAVHWKNTTLAKRSIAEEIAALRQQPGKDILLGSPSMIVAAANLGFIDEYQLSVHPIIAEKGLRLFENIRQRIDLQLIQTKTFRSGIVTLYYEPVKAVAGV